MLMHITEKKRKFLGVGIGINKMFITKAQSIIIPA